MNIENCNLPSDKVEEFAKNYSKNKKFPLRNLYVFTVIDKNGNVKDEKFGVNLMTRSGFDYSPIDGSYYSMKLYLGDGSGTPSYEDTTLFHYLGHVSKPYDTSKSNFPLFYDSDRDLICQRRKIGRYMLDYTFLNTSFDITEFGLSYHDYEDLLLTHGLVLDSSGQPSSIRKELYDKMIIEIRWMYVMSPEVQRRLIGAGIYGILQPNWLYGDQTLYCQWWSNTYIPYDSYTHQSDDNEVYINRYTSAVSKNAQIRRCDKFIAAPAILCERNYEYISNIRLASSDYVGYYDLNQLFIMPVYGDREELVCDHIFSDDNTPNLSLNNVFQSVIRSGFNDSYGYGIFPVGNFKIESSYMYNHKDHLWNIADTFTSCENSEFNELCLTYSSSAWMQNPDGISKTVYIFTNNNVNIPITKFEVRSIVLYATDEWWDNTTWILITNFSELTQSQGTKRYYISESVVEGGLRPTRNQQFPKFICDRKQYTWDTEHTYDSSDVVSPLMVSDQYEMYCTPYYMFFHPEGLPGGYDQVTACVQRDLRFTWPQSVVGNTTAKEVSTAYRHCFDDKVVICSGWYYDEHDWSHTNTSTSATHIRILDISDPLINMNPNVDLPYVDIQLDFTNKTREHAGDISHAWDGDFWIGYEPNAKEIVAVKIHGGQNQDTPTQTLVDSGILSYNFDYGNHHLIYTKDGMTFYYYNMETSTVTDTIDIQSFDSSVTEIKGYVGYNGIIYITAKYATGDWFTYFYNTSTQEWKVDKTIWTNSFGWNCMCGYNNECAIMCPDNANYGEMVIVRPDKPYEFMKLAHENIKHIYPRTCHLTYINNNKQLVFGFPSTNKGDNYYEWSPHWYNILDIGLILDTDSFPPIYTRNTDVWKRQTKIDQSCIYKGDVLFRGNFMGSDISTINILPIEKFICHKMTISTNSLSGYNNPFSLPYTEFFQILYSTTMDRLTMDPVDPQSCCYCTIYRIDMFESTTLAHRFVPCVRDTDSVPGLYDTIADEFLEPLDPLSITADTSTTITTDYNLPSGYTQVYSIAHTSGDANWFTTANMTTPIIHTQNTKVEWYGNIPTPPTGTTSMCLFGSQECDNEDEHHFEFWSARNGGFGYRRGTSTIETNTGTYDTDIKIVCDGLTASWYDITGTTLIDSITCTGTLDDGKTPFAFLTRGLPNGYDYNPQP